MKKLLYFTDWCIQWNSNTGHVQYWNWESVSHCWKFVIQALSWILVHKLVDLSVFSWFWTLLVQYLSHNLNIRPKMSENIWKWKKCLVFGKENNSKTKQLKVWHLDKSSNQMYGIWISTPSILWSSTYYYIFNWTHCLKLHLN